MPRSNGSRRRSLIALASFAATLLLSQNSLSAPRAVPLAKGEPAPFAGQLIDTETAITLGTKAADCGSRTATEVTRAVRLVQVDVDLCQRHREIDHEASLATIDAVELRLDAASAWYRSPVFVASVSVVLTLGAVLVARYAVVEPSWK